MYSSFPLWSGQPIVQGMFLLYKLEQMARKDPSIPTKQPFKAAFKHDKEYLKTERMPVILELLDCLRADGFMTKFVLERL